jgi:DsbC/DsbD-like thiol-disulfide interchange protein
MNPPVPVLQPFVRLKYAAMMRMISFLFTAMLCLLVLGNTAPAQTPPQTQVSLITEDSSTKPGSQELVGILFQLPPGWHIYWINPGDSGQPPNVQWALPAGWTAGTIEWPAPERLSNPAGVDYGYTGEVTLLSKVKVPETATPGVAELRADLYWLICKEMCVSQKGQARLTLAVGGKPAPNPYGRQKIVATQAKLPKALPADWKVNVLSNPRQFLLNFMPGVKVEKAEFFPADPQVIENASAQKLSATSTRAQLSLDKGEAAKKTAALKGVLVLNGTDVYTVNVPIKR